MIGVAQRIIQLVETSRFIHRKLMASESSMKHAGKRPVTYTSSDPSKKQRHCSDCDSSSYSSDDSSSSSGESQTVSETESCPSTQYTLVERYEDETYETKLKKFDPVDIPDSAHIAAGGVLINSPQLAGGVCEAISKSIPSEWKNYTRKLELIAIIRDEMVRNYSPYRKIKLFHDICQAYGGPDAMSSLFLETQNLDLDYSKIKDPRLRAVKTNIRLLVRFSRIWAHITGKLFEDWKFGRDLPDSSESSYKSLFLRYLDETYLAKVDSRAAFKNSKDVEAFNSANFDVVEPNGLLQVKAIVKAANRLDYGSMVVNELVNSCHPSRPNIAIPIVLLDTIILTHKSLYRLAGRAKYT